MICLIRDFLGPGDCDRVRAAMDQGLAEPAEVLREGARLDRDARLATLIEPDSAVREDIEARLDAVRTVVADHQRVLLHGREGPGFVRYRPGGYYLPHRDIADDPEWHQGAQRRISVVVFLNTSREDPPAGGFSGGELVIFPESRRAGDALRIVPTQGFLVAFHADMLHEVQPVRAGTRDVIVDWYY